MGAKFSLASASTAAAPGREPLLFTPGPLTTSAAVKQAMLVDYGSRDRLFTDSVSGIRSGLLRAAGAAKEAAELAPGAQVRLSGLTKRPEFNGGSGIVEEWLAEKGRWSVRMDDGSAVTVKPGNIECSQTGGFECVIIQGAGTMGVESVLGSVVPRDGKVLILVNGAYGHRQAAMCRYLGIDHELVEWPDSEAVSVEGALGALRADASMAEAAGRKPKITTLSVVHHETTAGVINPLEDLARAVKAEFPHVQLVVDSMSGFGAYDLRMDWGLDFVVSSANKCIEGVPGFSFAICRRTLLEASKGTARSLSMDLYEQWRSLEGSGQFRFTPPTHALLAFRQALAEWEAEGGVAGRGGRYRANYEVIRRGMEEMGFEFYVPESHRSFVISTFLVPEHRGFEFTAFYNGLAERGFVIYPGKLAQGESFRFGTIGRLFPRDCEALIAAVRAVCTEMGVSLPLK